MTSLADKVVAIGTALDAAELPYGFGGALALAWCTQRARGTIDIDVNVFLDAADARRAMEALPREVAWSDADVARVIDDGQVRLWWGTTPVDLFLDTTDFHRDAATRVRREPFGGSDVAFLGCSDLAVFKAFFDRSKDWVDLEEMVALGSLDIDRVLGVLARYLGDNDHRITRLKALGRPA
ncbi:MAG: hypothetical protein ACOYL9_07075 [Ilumatobacteraceae bacterium]